MPEPRPLSTLEKALEINLDPARYGTFAEIGAGQEVVRWFFQAGGAAGTISKSISAYDMQVSDAIYGDCERYVSRQRLEAMLACEQALNRERLAEQRGTKAGFFTFADTVSARNYHGTNECHAWMGVRYQHRPGADDSTIIIHVRMLDDTNAAQQEAIGIVGVNLVYGAFRFFEQPERLLATLSDGLSNSRIEVDMVDVAGPAFDGADNRILTLRLVELGLTGAAMFDANGKVLQPSEALRKKSLLVQRGRFRPITHVNIDLLECARQKFEAISGDEAKDLLPIMEISMHNLMDESDMCLEDFLARAEVVSTTGCTVMISDFQQYHRLAAYLFRYTHRPIGLAMGLHALRNLFEARYYDDLEGGLLEGFGRLFKDQLRLFIYPVKNGSGVENVDQLEFEPALQHLFDYLEARGSIVPLDNATTDYLDIHSPDVLRLIAEGSERWCSMVPKCVAGKIREQRLFGYGG